jgi:hypothetical protein
MDDKSINGKVVQALEKELKEKGSSSQWSGEVCHIPCMPSFLGLMAKVNFCLYFDPDISSNLFIRPSFLFSFPKAAKEQTKSRPKKQSRQKTSIATSMTVVEQPRAVINSLIMASTNTVPRGNRTLAVSQLQRPTYVGVLRALLPRRRKRVWRLSSSQRFAQFKTVWNNSVTPST